MNRCCGPSGLELDLAAHRVTVDGEEVHLTPTEFDLLRALMQDRGRLLTHRTLLREVWGPAYESDTQILRVHIANLGARSSRNPAPRATSSPIPASDTASRADRGDLDNIFIHRKPFLMTA